MREEDEAWERHDGRGGGGSSHVQSRQEDK